MSSLINVSKASKNPYVPRKTLKFGDMFLVKNSKAVPRGCLGERTIPPSQEIRYDSVNLLTEERSSTVNGDTPVQLIGKFEIHATFGPGFEDYADMVADAQS